MMATLTMSGIRASGMNQAAGRYSYQCSIIVLRIVVTQKAAQRRWCLYAVQFSKRRGEPKMMDGWC